MSEVEVQFEKDDLTSVRQKRLHREEFIRQYGALIMLCFLLVFNSLATRNFFHRGTFLNLVVQATPMMLIGLGMTFVCASGSIDISVGSAMALIGMTIPRLFPVLGMQISIVAGLAIALLIGAIIGAFIAFFRVQPIIVTLTFHLILRGIALISNNGRVLRISQRGYEVIGSTRVFDGLPIQLVYVLALMFVFVFIAEKTMFGRRIEAIGDNRKAARLNGINIWKYTIAVHAIVAFLAALAAIITTSRLMSCDPSAMGSGVEMDTIAAVAIGGTPLMGGKPRIMGTIIGAIIIQILYIMVVMNGLPYELSQTIKGCMILLAILVQRERFTA